MGPRRMGKKADKAEEEEKETSDAPMDVQTETGAEEDVHGDVEMTNEEPANEEEEEEEEDEEEEEEDGEEEPAVDGASPARKKGKTKKVKLTPYQKRFGQVSESGGLEVEDVDEEIDEKGETKITKDGELLGGKFSCCGIRTTNSKM